MNVLQVYWVVFVVSFYLIDLKLLVDVLGLCLFCGMLLVVSVVQVCLFYVVYCYLLCLLCVCQWYYVCVQCSQCGVVGKDIVYCVLVEVDGDSGEVVCESVVCVEICDYCCSYCKILYLEKDLLLELVVDDFGMLVLDLLLVEEGYVCVSQNLLLW